jgi:DNA topoisomerase-1
MARKLVIVESPSKAKTIKKFLGPDFEVRASAGHIVDLPLKGLGINVRKRFAPRYEIIKGKESVLAELRAATRDVEEVYLAPDPDREGEAISWHLANVLDLPQPRRAIFNEITSTAVQQGIAAPRAIDPNLVNAQQARRILDRLVGYKISPILWRKVLGNTSAGRVQSVALRLICEREKEIRAFVPEEYWTVTARLSSRGRQRKAFEAKLVGRLQDGTTTKLDPRSEAEAQALADELRATTFVVGTVTHKTQRRQAPAPYTTSTLQQDASSRLRFSPKKTMSVAQELYEGVDLGERGMQGLLTYIRTDSTRVADEAVAAAQELITSRFGKRYVRAGPQPTARRARHVQDAHEAIRPTDVMITPEEARPHLTGEQARLYTLVWQRFVASQMAPAVLATTSAEITTGALLLQASGTTLEFEGFYAVWPREGDKDTVLPALAEGAALTLLDVETVQHWTQGPQRYTEASLIKELEELGVGRPSTYVPTLVTIQKRKYVALEQRRFVPLWLGETVNELMTRHFPEIVDTKFTAAMERKLDEVEEGKQEWIDLLSRFYDEFKTTLSEAEEKIGPVEKPVEETDQICPVCGSSMVIKLGRFGRFLSCSNYPTCTHSEQLLARIGVLCPEPGCGGDVIERHTRRGRVFYGCSNYPTCRFASWDRPLAERCPACGGLQVALGGRHAGQVRCTACARTVDAPSEAPDAQQDTERSREPAEVGA